MADGAVTAVTVNPAGTLSMAGSRDGHVSVWDLESACEVARLSRGLRGVTGLECSGCGNLMAIADRSVRNEMRFEV